MLLHTLWRTAATVEQCSLQLTGYQSIVSGADCLLICMSRLTLWYTPILVVCHCHRAELLEFLEDNYWAVAAKCLASPPLPPPSSPNNTQDPCISVLARQTLTTDVASQIR